MPYIRRQKSAELELTLDGSSSIITFGRADELVDIHVPLPEVSRQHCYISLVAASWFLTDGDQLGTNSANGTFLNGRKIDGPEPLEDGDYIGIGKEIFVFQLTDTKTQLSIKDKISVLRDKLSNFDDGIATLGVLDDENQTIGYCNGSAARVFSYERNELEGVSLAVVLPDDISSKHKDMMQGMIADSFTKEMSAGKAVLAVAKTGETLYLTVTRSAIMVPKVGRVYVGQLTPATESTETDRKLNYIAAVLTANRKSFNRILFGLIALVTTQLPVVLELIADFIQAINGNE
ncbi:MAG: FHA domain-containing protein [Cyanobacteria bacterium J06627_3]